MRTATSEMPCGQRIGQLVVNLQMVKLFVVGEQAEDEDLDNVLCVVAGVNMVKSWLSRQSAS